MLNHLTFLKAIAYNLYMISFVYIHSFEKHNLVLSLSEIVVAESVVVIKKLLQTQPAHHSEIIKHMAKLLDSITVSICASFNIIFDNILEL